MGFAKINKCSHTGWKVGWGKEKLTPITKGFEISPADLQQMGIGDTRYRSTNLSF